MVLVFALVLSVATNYLSDRTYAFEVRDNGYGLQVDHKKVHGRDNQGNLFNISNLAPGEEYSEVITMKNVRSESFQSLITVINTSKQGNLLFNSLDFSIREGNANGVVLFDGKLKDLKNVVLCTLSAKKFKTYYMTLGLPAESGNDYQKKSAGFKFVITAAANMPTNDGKDFDKNHNNKKNKH